MIKKTDFCKQDSRDTWALFFNFISFAFAMSFVGVFAFSLLGICWYMVLTWDLSTDYLYLTAGMTLFMLLLAYWNRDIAYRAIKSYKVIGQRNEYLEDLLDHLVGYKSIQIVEMKDSDLRSGKGYESILLEGSELKPVNMKALVSHDTLDEYFEIFEGDGTVAYVHDRWLGTWYKATK